LPWPTLGVIPINAVTFLQLKRHTSPSLNNTSKCVMVGCRARIRTWAKGSKVPCATTTQLGN
jgi:hypothetical protein